MAERKNGNRSRLVAVWPGMGQVAVTAGYYLMSKLPMNEEEAPASDELFDLDHVEIRRRPGACRASAEDKAF